MKRTFGGNEVMQLIERALAYLRCPACASESLAATQSELACERCSARYPIRDGIIDFFPDYGSARDPVQKPMEQRHMVRIYEDHFRPWYHSLASRIRYDEERTWLLERQRGAVPGCVLDVAAGTGRYTRILADALRPEVAIAVDLSMPMLAQARRLARRQGADRILFLHGDAQCLPVRSGVAAVLNCFAALHLFPDPYRAIDELGRCARPNASLTCLTIARREEPATTLRHRLFLRISPFRPHLTVDGLRARLAAAGFEEPQFTQQDWVLLFSAKRRSKPERLDARRRDPGCETEPAVTAGAPGG